MTGRSIERERDAQASTGADQGTTATAGADTAMVEEISRVLQVRRWEVQEGPFRGFGSPPGKF